MYKLLAFIPIVSLAYLLASLYVNWWLPSQTSLWQILLLLPFGAIYGFIVYKLLNVPFKKHASVNEHIAYASFGMFIGHMLVAIPFYLGSTH